MHVCIYMCVCVCGLSNRQCLRPTVPTPAPHTQVRICVYICVCVSVSVCVCVCPEQQAAPAPNRAHPSTTHPGTHMCMYMCVCLSVCVCVCVFVLSNKQRLRPTMPTPAPYTQVRVCVRVCLFVRGRLFMGFRFLHNLTILLHNLTILLTILLDKHQTCSIDQPPCTSAA